MRKSLIAIFHGALCIGAVSALNLQPQEITVEKDGPPVRRYFFTDQSKKILFRIDGRMTVTGSANQAIFHFADIRNATSRLTKSAMTPETTFAAKNLELYRTAVRGFIPADATNVQSLEERSDAIPINGWASHQFLVNYKMFGTGYRQSVTFVNYSATEQLVFDVMSEDKDYEKAYARSYSVLNSLCDYVAGREDPSS
jgi:hypothetical protein